MLASFLRMLHRARRQGLSRDSKPSDACVECEYSFYNHEANLPFDQLEECLRARRDALMQEHPPVAEPAPVGTRPRWADRSADSG
ncbi:hypothetical protein [Dickeya zeae]|uniref:Uncharacterized protein n=1 Tax=Dickeya zeae TaxID=204042 RepID=A0AAE6YZP2_9GAMM|nr:hypothetical protein [Dickeya zeae]QIZ50808.1 hypothetical protein DWG24_08490 [Dickeya zeae]QYM90603.1 hypothetical protein FGI21_01325 [Dickeya zeae]